MNRTPVIISLTLLFWAGFVSSISFMEAWLKFQAPGVTLPIGLSIGKLVFIALNRMEWIFLIILSLLTVNRFNAFPKKFISMGATVLLILLVQTFILLPELNQRVEMIVSGTTPGTSNVHMLFGIAEVLKVILLIYMGFYTTKIHNISS